jgi:acyl-CoA thioester hydrolase
VRRVQGMTMAGGHAENLGVEVWRGGVNTWECDEMGHMNVRFYVTRAMEGLVGLAAALGMPKAYTPDAGASLILREQHIRFLREAHPGGLLHMRAAVISMDETEAQVLQVLYHTTTGEPAATYVSRVSHITAQDARPFPWTRQTRALAAGLTVAVPAYAAPRGLDLGPVETQASLARAKALGVRAIASGAVSPQDCDVFGRMRAEQFIGRISDGIPQLVGEVRSIIASNSPQKPKRVGGAVLEYRLAYLDWPRAGDRMTVHSGLAAIEGTTQRIVHWILDPSTGRPWATSMAVAATLDLDARKIVAVTPAAREKLTALAVEGLTL